MAPRSEPGHRTVPLPLLASHEGGRAAMTCRYRCGDACFHPAPNTSDNPYLGDVITGALSRRSMLRAGAVVTLAAGAVAGTAVLTGTASAAPATTTGNPGPGAVPPGLRFAPVAPNTADAVIIPPGYEQEVVIRWGDPVLAGAAQFSPAGQSAAAQARQFG